MTESKRNQETVIQLQDPLAQLTAEELALAHDSTMGTYIDCWIKLRFDRTQLDDGTAQRLTELYDVTARLLQLSTEYARRAAAAGNWSDAAFREVAGTTTTLGLLRRLQNDTFLSLGKPELAAVSPETVHSLKG